MTNNLPVDQAPPTSIVRSLPERLRSDWLLCLIILIVGFAVRLPALQGEPIWDDDYLIRTNPFIKSPLLIFEAFRHYLFQDTYSAHYRPVQNLSYMADYFFWNTNFAGFHLTSILCHVSSGVLLFLLLRKLISSPSPRAGGDAAQVTEADNGTSATVAPFLVALLWVVHPVHSAAVDYVSGRADSLAFFFACAGWLFFHAATEQSPYAQRWTRFILAWICGLLSLCSRESGGIWIAIFLFYLFLFDDSRNRSQKWLVTTACAVMVLAYLALRHLPGPAYIPNSPSEITTALRPVLMLRALGEYGRLMLFPLNLHMERTVFDPKAFHSQVGRWNAIQQEYLSIGGLTLLIAFGVLSAFRGRGQRIRILGAIWFLLAYLPISNLVDLNATVAEHWLYLPSVGFLIFLAGCALDLSPQWQRVAAGCACAAVLALGVRSAMRSSDWTSNEIFARRTIAAGGATIRIVLLLGSAYANRGDYAAAERLLKKAIQLSPDYPTIRNNLADALVHQGKKEEAETLFVHSAEVARESRKDYPRTWIAALNLSQMRHTEHDDAGAIRVLEDARKVFPDTWELIGAESELLRETGQVDSALDLIKPFAQKNWWHYRAWAALGRLLAQKGDVSGATATLRTASLLDIHETAALNLIALIRMRQNRLEEALRTQTKAVAREPDQPRQYLLLSNILDKMGRDEEARAALAQVSRLRTLARSDTTVN